MDYPGNLFVVAAPSGAGKSSLVKAGLAPYLRKLSAGRQRDLVRILTPIRPADSPLRVLNRLLSSELTDGTVRPEEPANLAAEQAAANIAAVIVSEDQIGEIVEKVARTIRAVA